MATRLESTLEREHTCQDAKRLKICQQTTYFFYARNHIAFGAIIFFYKREANMLQALLSQKIYSKVATLDFIKLQEIRLRRNAPVQVNYNGEKKYLTYDSGEKIFVQREDIERALKVATENSLYAFNNQIKQGFITARGGIRLGIAGESVNADNFMPTTIKNISSINIRIPHEVVGCSKVAFKFIASESEIKNTLIISPPGAGKTTFLRDIARNISHLDKIYNCLLVDERFELASCLDGQPMLDVGENTDVVSGANKKFAFTNGIRTLRPDVIITDELIGEEDALACKYAIRSGVKVIASIHANNHVELLDKSEFKPLLNGKYFERIIILSNRRGVGTIEKILDEGLNCIYF